MLPYKQHNGIVHHLIFTMKVKIICLVFPITHHVKILVLAHSAIVIVKEAHAFSYQL